MTAEQRKELERVLDSLAYRYLVDHAIGEDVRPHSWNYGRARRDAIRKIEKILKGAK